MADMRLVILGAGGRMGRTLVKLIADTPGAAVVGAVEQPGSGLPASPPTTWESSGRRLRARPSCSRAT